MELKELNLDEETTKQLEKIIQSETDKVRTDYSQRLKAVNEELSTLKPREKSDAEKELEELKKELSKAKFDKALNELGVDSGMAKYLKADIDIAEFGEYFKGFSNQRQDYTPKDHVKNCGVTKEQFKRMGIEEKTKLYSENPELYAQLKNN